MAGEPEPDALNPEKDCPLSMLATLEQLDEQASRRRREGGRPVGERAARRAASQGELGSGRLRAGSRRLPADVARAAGWKSRRPTDWRRRRRPSSADSDYPCYHLVFDIEVKNVGDRPHKVAYRLDGPNGLPREGWWFAYKVSRTLGRRGLARFDRQVRRGRDADGRLPDDRRRQGPRRRGASD